jgi:hypothetical protein
MSAFVSQVPQAMHYIDSRWGRRARYPHEHMQELHCIACGHPTPNHDIINVGSIQQGYKPFCTRCFNLQIAKLNGLEAFQHANFASVGLADAEGKIHEFRFRVRLLGPQVALDAFELRNDEPAGYQFQLIGPAAGDLMELLARLITKIRRALSVRHLEQTASGLRIADHNTVRGVIAWGSDNDGELPLLVVDGQEITWEQLGRMMMSFEGWQFKLEIRDKSEEI